MNKVFFNLFDNNDLYENLSSKLQYEKGSVTLRQFPDQETYLRVASEVSNKEIIILCSLNQPNTKLLPLKLLVRTLRDLGAKKITLICPYLAYMRQDTRFKAGEALSAKYFAEILQQDIDCLITVDPHLHRYHDLSAIYNINTRTIHATTPIATWINLNVQQPIIIGPDAESEQWVKAIANKCNAPYLILLKKRLNDHEVEVSIPQLESYPGFAPVLVDDIISTAQTMIAANKHIQNLYKKSVICIGVHAIFAGSAYTDLKQSGAAQIITCNSIVHPSNQIDLAEEIAIILDTAAQHK